MTNKTTKRALFSSVVALVLCFAMLLGTTYAWFTDSVASGSNVITAGNLDIKVEYTLNGKDWKALDGATDLFQKGLWEPGHTEVVVLKIENKGTLALKYAAHMNIVNEIIGKNKDGGDIVLSDILTVSTLRGTNASIVTDAFADENRVVYDQTATFKAANVLGAEKAMAPAAVEYLVIKVDMAETVGNEANAKDKESLPSIEFGIDVLATQMTAEDDSFGNQYDAEASLPITNESDLRAALNKGGVFVLGKDIEVNADVAITVPSGVEVVLDLNGHNITGVSTANSENRSTIKVNGDMIVTGNGIVSYTHAGANMEWNALTAAFSVEGGVLTLDEGVSAINYGGTNMAYAVDVNSTPGKTELTVNGATVLSTYTAIRLFNNHKTAQAIVNANSGLISGDSRDIWVHNPSASAVDANGVVNLADSYEATVTTQAATSFYGRIYDFAVESTPVMSANGLIAALENGKDVTLMSDVKIEPASMSNAYGTTGINVNGQTIDGNGNVLDIKGAGGTWDSGICTSGGLIKNITVTGSFRGVFVKKNTEKVILDNVTIEGTTYTISCDQGNYGGLKATNSTFNGWTSYAKTIGEVEFVDCSFGAGAGYKYMRPYAPTSYVGCDFCEGYTIDAIAEITFENCTLNGEPLTTENLAQLMTSSSLAKATIK